MPAGAGAAGGAGGAGGAGPSPGPLSACVRRGAAAAPSRPARRLLRSGPRPAMRRRRRRRSSDSCGPAPPTRRGPIGARLGRGPAPHVLPGAADGGAVGRAAAGAGAGAPPLPHAQELRARAGRVRPSARGVQGRGERVSGAWAGRLRESCSPALIEPAWGEPRSVTGGGFGPRPQASARRGPLRCPPPQGNPDPAPDLSLVPFVCARRDPTRAPPRGSPWQGEPGSHAASQASDFQLCAREGTKPRKEDPGQTRSPL